MSVGSQFFARLRVLLRGLLLWCVFPVAGLLALCCLTLYLLCVYKGDVIASLVEQRLRSITSLPWQVRGPVMPVFSPSPGLALGNVRLFAASLEQEPAGKERGVLFSIKSLRVHVQVADLLRGKRVFSDVVLESPIITLACDAEGCPLWLPLPAASPGGDAGTAHLPGGHTVNTTAAEATAAEATAAEATAAEATAVNGLTGKNGIAAAGTAFPAASPGGAAETIGHIAAFLRSDMMHELPRMRLTNGTLQKIGPTGEVELAFTQVAAGITPDQEKPLSFSATFRLPPADLDVSFSLALGPGEGPVLLQGDLSGRVGITPPPHTRTLTGDFSTRLIWQKNGQELLLPDFALTAEGDSITASLTADTLTQECTGPVYIHKLSLPRWFVFGRVLPPGLQQALDTLTGEFTFRGNAKGVGAFELKGQAGELAVTGYVGTPDFSAPVVEVFLDLETANLDMIFPFLSPPGTIFPDPVSPEFAYPPLVPYPEEEPEGTPGAKPPPAEGEGISVGYDVRIRVAKPVVHQVAGGPAEVLVFEHPSGATRVAFTGKNLLKGAASGYIDIEDKAVRMHYAADKMQLALLPENQGSPVQVSGVVSGTGDITIAVDKKGNWADTWKLDVAADVENCELTGGKGAKGWRLHADKAKASGGSSIYTVTSRGVRIDGLWDLAVQGVHTSWYPKGKDAISGQFQGALEWPPIKDGPPLMRNGKPVRQRKALETLSGKLNASGSLIVPIASKRVPVKGKGQAELTWRVYDRTVTFDKLSLDGLGGYLAGKLTVDASGDTVAITAPVNFKLAPRTLLKEWNLLPGGRVQMPELVTGEGRVQGSPDSVLFDSLKLQVDGASVTGDISGNFALPAKGKQEEKAPADSAGNHWVFNLEAERLDLDAYFQEAGPEEQAAPPSTRLWDFSPLQDFTMDADVLLKNSKFRKLYMRGTHLLATLRKGRFSVQSTTADFYGGTGSLVLQGTFLPELSLVSLQRGLVDLKGVALGPALHDLTKDNSYGGKMDFTMDVKGSLKRNADMPAALSGGWNMAISDGVYPAFVGEASGLRNTFSKATASGVMERGVVKWDNFALHGMMVDMDGGGWIDFVKKIMDFSINVTLARVPSVPVRFHGGFAEPTMSVQGVRMVVNTAQNAGSTVFGLFTGVLELPGRALRGVGDLFGNKPPEKGPVKTSPQKEPEQ